MKPRILTPDELRALHARALRRADDGRVGRYQVQAAVMSADESTSELLPWSGDLPDIVGGWRIQVVLTFTDPVGNIFNPEAVARCTGDDILRVEMLAEPPSSLRKPEQSMSEVELRGRFAVVGSPREPTLAHVSDVGAVALNFVDLVPVDEDRSRHHRTPDGRRVAGFFCIVDAPEDARRFKGQDIPPMILRMIAERDQATAQATDRQIVVIPSASANLFPSVPSVGERKRMGKDAPMPRLEAIAKTLNARRREVGVKVKLDDASMRLASASFVKNPKHRKQAVQLRIPYPTEATATADMQAAVQAALAHFDTDYLLTFDAVTAILAQTPQGVGMALDDELRRRVVDMRFGSTMAAGGPQARRVATHFDTLCQIVVEVVPTDPSNTRVFRGRIILPTGEMLDRNDPDREIKVGDVVMLNPSLYQDMAKGKGLFLDERYFRFDPYRQDWEMRLYRYLAARWSMSSVALEKRNDWRIVLKLVDMLDMAGVDWRTATQRGRGEGEQRRRAEATLASLERDGLIGSWIIDGDGLKRTTMLSVGVAPTLRAALVGRRPRLHAAAAEGGLKPAPKRPKAASRKD